VTVGLSDNLLVKLTGEKNVIGCFDGMARLSCLITGM
jgi:hypothetical protein